MVPSRLPLREAAQPRALHGGGDLAPGLCAGDKLLQVAEPRLAAFRNSNGNAIKIELSGGYHEFGEFVSGIAALPRIVTLHDIEITRGGAANRASSRGRALNPSDELTLNLTAKTYRYLEEGESDTADAGGKGGKKDSKTKPKRNTT